MLKRAFHLNYLGTHLIPSALLCSRVPICSMSWVCVALPGPKEPIQDSLVARQMGQANGSQRRAGGSQAVLCSGHLPQGLVARGSCTPVSFEAIAGAPAALNHVGQWPGRLRKTRVGFLAGPFAEIDCPSVASLPRNRCVEQACCQPTACFLFVFARQLLDA